MITVHIASIAALTFLIGSSCSEAPAEAGTAADSEGQSKGAAPQYEGSVLYGRFCLSCHGETGIGDGVSATMLTIKPRDFTAGIFKFRSVVEGLPTDADLARTIAKGIGGTEMSAYETLPPEAIDALVQHVKSLTVGNIEVADEEEAQELPGLVEVIEDKGTFYARVNWFELRGSGAPLVVGTPPKPTAEMVARGKELFEGIAACVTCHGKEGRGDGDAGKDLKDDWGFSITPRNFTEDILKGGDDLQDIYQRIMLGIPGTPMPASGELLGGPDDAWAIVYYVQKLRRKLYIPK